MKAWQDDVVPSDISSNPVMARAYSQIVFGYFLLKSFKDFKAS